MPQLRQKKSMAKPVDSDSDSATLADVHRLPEDIFVRIFTLALPTSALAPVSNDSESAINILATSAPHNISWVCCSWRQIVLSSPSQWSSFFYSFADPSEKVLNRLYRLVERHLDRSLDLPLTCDVHLKGSYSDVLSMKISGLLSKHQDRWRNVGIWFETGEYSSIYTDDVPVPVPPTRLIVEDIAHLEELRITFSTEYSVSSRTDRHLQNSLPSLARLELQTLSSPQEGMRWLDFAPNLRELRLGYSHYYYGRGYPSPYSPPPYHIIPQIHMTKLSITHISRIRTSAGEFTLNHMTCPALTELHLHLNFETVNNRSLYQFLLRSRPDALKVFELEEIPDTVSADSMLEVLTLVPSLRSFIVHGLLVHAADALYEALARTTDSSGTATSFALLPALENLEVILSSVSDLLMDFAVARWNVHGRTFKSLTLTKGFASKSTGYGFAIESIPPFDFNEGIEHLSPVWTKLRTPIEEGFRFNADSY